MKAEIPKLEKDPKELKNVKREIERLCGVMSIGEEQVVDDNLKELESVDDIERSIKEEKERLVLETDTLCPPSIS